MRTARDCFSQQRELFRRRLSPPAAHAARAIMTPVQLYDSYNNAFGAMAPGSDSPGSVVRFLGIFAGDHEQCEAACLRAAPRCWSYVHFKDEAKNGTAGSCYSVTSPGWNPSYDATARTGVVDWPCRDNEDCSLNGECTSGRCDCRAAWIGHRCETLVTLPAKRNGGYHGKDSGRNSSSWGAAVLRGSDGLFHMWVSEMTEHCGIGAWHHNSRIVHATSETPDGAFERQSVTWPVFAHEPSVVPGPNGEFVMFFTADFDRANGGARGGCRCCQGARSPCDGSTGPNDCSAAPSTVRHFSYMSWTMDPNGGWSKPVKLFNVKHQSFRGGDTNFSPLILSNGSLIGLWRKWTKTGSRSGSRVFVATARDWRNASCYVQHKTKPIRRHQTSAELFPDLGASGAEDQFLYLDDQGNYHAYFHNMVGSGSAKRWWLDATGGHAFSRNGWDWTYGGVAWGDPLQRFDTPEGRGSLVPFVDGPSVRFTRVERPHLVFAGGRLRGDPTHLVASAQYGAGVSASTDSRNDDGTCTIILPVRRGGSAKLPTATGGGRRRERRAQP